LLLGLCAVMRVELMGKSDSITCNDCGMGYVRELEDNVLAHEKYHDKVVNGLCAPPLRSDCVVWRHDNERITVVRQSSLREQLDRAEEIGRCARKDAGYGAEELFDEKMEVRVFLLHKEDRVIGFLLMDKRDHVYRGNWDEYDAGKQPEKMLDYPPIWSVCLVWVLKKHRRVGFAKTVLGKALTYLKYSLDNIGWYPSSSPPAFTSSGEAFVRSCCPNEFYIAK